MHGPGEEISAKIAIGVGCGPPSNGLPPVNPRVLATDIRGNLLLLF